MITRDSNSELETLVEINWESFEKDAFLSEIEVNWIQTAPIKFKGKKTGTLIEIQNPQKHWNKDMVIKLAQKLQSLQSPFKEKSNFEIELKCQRYPDVQKNIRFIDEILEKAVYSLVGTISHDGFLTAKYNFFNPAFRNLAREIPITMKDIKDIGHFKGTRKFPKCGEIEVRLYVWDLDPATLSETITRGIYRRLIRPHTGISVYRDNFRLWPYGERRNDWLGLDQRRVNNPTNFLSNNQIVGIIDISQRKNPKLVDKTDREGLIQNEEYADFSSLVLSAIGELEVYRRKNKTAVDNLRERKTGKKLTSTRDAIENLKTSLETDGALETYNNLVTEIEQAYLFEVKNVHEPLITGAGLGIAFQMPAHEIQIQLNGLRETMDNFENIMSRLGLSGRIVEELSNARKIISIIDDVSDGALELSRRKKISFSLQSAIKFAEKIKGAELKRAEIKSVYDIRENISINGYQNYFITSVLNLIDNSIWWLQKIDGERIIKFTIKRNDLGNPIVIVSDNGPGIDESDVNYLGTVYFTRKLHGTGLGLFIVKRAMSVNNGTLKFGFYDDDPDYLKGANVILTLGEGDRKK